MKKLLALLLILCLALPAAALVEETPPKVKFSAANSRCPVSVLRSRQLQGGIRRYVASQRAVRVILVNLNRL